MMKGDRECVLEAVARNRMALKHASLELKGDREVLLAAVAKHAPALAWASARLQSDPEVVLAALRLRWSTRPLGCGLWWSGGGAGRLDAGMSVAGGAGPGGGAGRGGAG
jgi:hypothetical protein